MRRLRDFVASRPGPATDWTPWLKFVVIQTSNCRPFAKQCLANEINLHPARAAVGSCTHNHNHNHDEQQPRRPALAQALSWARVARVHHALVTTLYLYDLIKFRLLASVSRERPHLDCFVLGRFRFVGRTNKISGEVASLFLFWFLVYRWTIHLLVPGFKFFPLEFLMSSQAEVGRHERRPTIVLPGGNQPRVSGSGARAHPLRQPRGRHTGQVDTVFYLKSPFELQTDRWILRPNRTSAGWRALSLYTKWLFYYSLVTLVNWVSLMYWALGGSVLTNLGFEMAYPTCVAWLRDLQGAPGGVSSNYSQIYLAPRVLAHEIPIDEIPARIPWDARLFPRLSPYSFARILVDALENHLFYLEYVLIFVAQFYMLAIHSADVVLNSVAIEARLAGLIERMEPSTSARGSLVDEIAEARPGLGPINRSRLSVCRRLSLRRQQASLVLGRRRSVDGGTLALEVADLQAILCDHFDNITRGYNLYISFSMGLLVLCWLTYTVVICVWMSNVKSRAIEWEFVVAESGATLVSLVLMASAALVRSRNLKLYPLITRAMALDSSGSMTKLHWITILNYFHPRPLYCFTIFDSAEISWLLCLKLLFWIISAFIILANFFYMSRQ